MLDVSNIRFSYEKPVLNGLSFNVGDGELLAILGPNGSGKSTLVKLIVGILDPESGVVSIDGRRLASMSRRESAQLIGYVAQDSSVRFPLTAFELVLQGRFAQGRLIGFESERDVREAEWAMEVTETTDFSEQRHREPTRHDRK